MTYVLTVSFFALIGLLFLLYKRIETPLFIRKRRLRLLPGYNQEPRDLIVLYKMLLLTMYSETKCYGGICGYIASLNHTKLMCSLLEKKMLNSHFKTIERPTGRGTTPGSAYYWLRKDIAVRRNFIRKIIKDLENERART